MRFFFFQRQTKGKRKNRQITSYLPTLVNDVHFYMWLPGKKNHWSFSCRTQPKTHPLHSTVVGRTWTCIAKLTFTRIQNMIFFFGGNKSMSNIQLGKELMKFVSVRYACVKPKKALKEKYKVFSLEQPSTHLNTDSIFKSWISGVENSRSIYNNYCKEKIFFVKKYRKIKKRIPLKNYKN